MDEVTTALAIACAQSSARHGGIRVGEVETRTTLGLDPEEVHRYERQASRAVKIMDSGARPPGFEGWLLFFLAVPLWESDKSSQCPTFLIYKMDIMVAYASKGYCED